MSFFESITDEVTSQLRTCGLPLRWIGIHDPAVIALTGPFTSKHGTDFQESWDFLCELPRGAKTTEVVSRITALCIPNLAVVDEIAASVNETGGGSVVIELGPKTDIRKVLGASLHQFGNVGVNRLQETRWVGLAVPQQDFGLTCMAREITRPALPYSEPPVVGFEWFIQGLNEEKTTTLRSLAS